MAKKSNQVVDVVEVVAEVVAEVASQPVVVSASEAIEAKLNPLRQAVADSQAVVYGAERALASAYNEVYAFDWFAVEYREVSDNAKVIAPEKKKLFELLNSKGHTNPSTVWARIRKHGHELRYPADTELKTGGADGVEVEQAEQGEKGNSRERSPKLRFIEELSALYKFGMRQENLADDVAEAHKLIVQALTALGVNVSLITK